jgi:hypothetical protein
MAAARFAFFVALVALALVLAAAAFAETIVNQKMQFTGASINECPDPDELVLVEGTIHTTSHVTVSGNRTHTSVDVHTTGVQGTALVTGARYVEMEINNQQENVSSDFTPFEFTSERTHNLTRLGEDGTFELGDDLRVHHIIHMTVNANGILTADKDEITIECR